MNENTHVYPEKSLQLAAVEWMANNWSYRELASDAEATGDRMDSIGLISGKPIAIEVKTQVHSGLVRHRHGQSGSLESKISSTLRGLYRGQEGAQLQSIRSYWDGKTPLTIGILAGSFTKPGFTELVSMLSARSKDWNFHFQVLLWTGHKVENLFEQRSVATPITGDWQSISIPDLVGRQSRAKRTLPDLYELAGVHGVRSIFDECLRLAREYRFSITTRATGVTLKLPPDLGGKSVLSLFLTGSNEVDGMNVGIDASSPKIKTDKLPGVVAPRAGFMNTNRFVKSNGDIKMLFECFKTFT